MLCFSCLVGFSFVVVFWYFVYYLYSVQGLVLPSLLECLGDSMGCQELNLGHLCTRKTPYPLHSGSCLDMHVSLSRNMVWRRKLNIQSYRMCLNYQQKHSGCIMVTRNKTGLCFSDNFMTGELHTVTATWKFINDRNVWLGDLFVLLGLGSHWAVFRGYCRLMPRGHSFCSGTHMVLRIKPKLPAY